MHFKISISQLKIVSSASNEIEMLSFYFNMQFFTANLLFVNSNTLCFSSNRLFCRQKHEIFHFETIVLQFKHYSLIQTGNSSIPTRNLLGQICTLFSALNKGLSMDEGLNQVWNWPNCLIRRCPLSHHDLKSTRSFWVSEDELL